MTSPSDSRVGAWKETFRSCVLQRGALHVRFPVSSLVTSDVDKVALQRQRVEKTFAPLIGESARAVVIGVDGDTRALRDTKELSELLDCGGSVCELNRAPSLVRRFADFFADHFRVDAKFGTYESSYPPYAELICVFPDPTAMPLAWIQEIEGMSLWNLGCLKTPLKALSPQARQVIGAATRKHQVAVTIKLGHAETAATLYVPSLAREVLANRVLQLDLKT
jgi:hypothetical protein